MSAIDRAAEVLDVYLPDGAHPRDAVAREAARDVFESIDIDDLARVLRRHAVDIEDWGNIRCACADMAWFDTAEEHRAHVAGAVKAHLLDGAS